MPNRNNRARDTEAQYDLRHLRHLIAVHEEGTLHAAAQRLHLSQSALTKSIQRLEESLAAELFDRRGRRLVLNPLGERVLARAKRVLSLADDVQREADLYVAAEIGEVRVGVGPVVALSHLPDVLARFCPRFPDVRVIVRNGSTANLVPRLLAGDLDVVVADYEHRTAHPDLEARSLGQDLIGIAVRPHHPVLACGKPYGIPELLAFPRAAATPPPRLVEWVEKHAASGLLKALEAGLTCDNYEVLISTAERTDMLVLGPLSMLRRYERMGRMVVLSVDYPSPASEPAVLHMRERPLAPAVLAFMREF